ncbi:MAG: hypothetical protein LUF25_07530 [Phascolarctobacterium sp.]|nr:hypothetical protein [Phascolarctobacterium sp.]
MNIYVWRHNKTYHSYSMIEEPCINNDFYLDALAIVAANTFDEALEVLAEENKGWRTDDLRELACRVYPADKAGVIFTELRGAIHHL